MHLFSHRKGLKIFSKSIQRESMDDDLRNCLWNSLTISLFGPQPQILINQDTLLEWIWIEYFKQPVDTKPLFDKPFGKSGYEILREHFFKCPWNEVYDLLEYISKWLNKMDAVYCNSFNSMCNHFLEQEKSAYRFIGTEISEITDKQEIQTIDNAIDNSPDAVRKHLETAIKFLSDRKTPDYRNSVKESISAVESLCRKISGMPKATLGDALQKIKEKVEIHKAFEDGLNKIYGYTCDEKGIRHSLLEEVEGRTSFSDAKFMLSSCAAFVNYLIAKCAENKIKIS
jgi:hypothetical protein